MLTPRHYCSSSFLYFSFLIFPVITIHKCKYFVMKTPARLPGSNVIPSGRNCRAHFNIEPAAREGSVLDDSEEVRSWNIFLNIKRTSRVDLFT